MIAVRCFHGFPVSVWLHCVWRSLTCFWLHASSPLFISSHLCCCISSSLLTSLVLTSAPASYLAFSPLLYSSIPLFLSPSLPSSSCLCGCLKVSPSRHGCLYCAAHNRNKPLFWLLFCGGGVDKDEERFVDGEREQKDKHHRNISMDQEYNLPTCIGNIYREDFLPFLCESLWTNPMNMSFSRN